MRRINRLYIIGLFFCLLLGGIYALETGIESRFSAAVLVEKDSHLKPSETAEKDAFASTDRALHYTDLYVPIEERRKLDEYYENRAYSGAPPTIPHEIDENHTIGDQNCLKCHQNGGFVPKFDAFAPISPHPNLKSCLQCHVAKNTNRVFRESGFEGWGKKHQQKRALRSSPPIIPHALQMHENCLSCHLGPSSPIEIRTTHPERVNCLQCHAKGDRSAEFGEWKRPFPRLKKDSNQ